MKTFLTGFFGLLLSVGAVACSSSGTDSSAPNDTVNESSLTPTNVAPAACLPDGYSCRPGTDQCCNGACNPLPPNMGGGGLCGPFI